MPELWKDKFNPETLRAFALLVQAAYPAFQAEAFIQSTLDETWDSLELKARGRQVCVNLGTYLPADYRTAIAICDEVIQDADEFYCLVFPDFVEVYGLDAGDWEVSMGALERYTQYGSSEFAVRQFIIRDEARMMEQMYAWSKHENEHVRRLSSEGCRPLLPWGQALVSFKQDPGPVLPILEQLKTDPSLYVRRSVANNLNDIAKNHPDLVAEIARDWHGKDEHTDWIIKHGCRTLLKKGHRAVLALFGYDDTTSVDVRDFALGAEAISIGEEMPFSFSIEVKKPTKVRLEYGVDYVKANGKRNRKIFQISEIAFKEAAKKDYTKRHSFADVSVRKHYPGVHSITLIVNGVERETLDFTLVS
ncbi:MAG: DNA alkylation repair protein [Oscillospiraceae bacterium]|nr:DNA alkylation repair protein [Oscillospiraceae bacterium]